MFRRSFIALSRITLAAILLPTSATATQPVRVGHRNTGDQWQGFLVQIFRTNQRDTLFVQSITSHGYFLQRVQVSGDADTTLQTITQSTPAEIGFGNMRDANIWPCDVEPNLFIVGGLHGLDVRAYPEGPEDPSVGTVTLALLAALYAWIYPQGRNGWTISFWSSDERVTIEADPAVDAPDDGSVVIPS